MTNLTKNYWKGLLNCQHREIPILSPMVILELSYCKTGQYPVQLTIDFRNRASWKYLCEVLSHLDLHKCAKNLIFYTMYIEKSAKSCQPCDKTADLELILYLVHQIITFIRYQIFIEGCLLYIWYLFELILTIIKPARSDLLHLVKTWQELILHCWEQPTSRTNNSKIDSPTALWPPYCVYIHN